MSLFSFPFYFRLNQFGTETIDSFMRQACEENILGDEVQNRLITETPFILFARLSSKHLGWKRAGRNFNQKGFQERLVSGERDVLCH